MCNTSVDRQLYIRSLTETNSRKTVVRYAVHRFPGIQFTSLHETVVADYDHKNSVDYGHETIVWIGLERNARDTPKLQWR